MAGVVVTEVIVRAVTLFYGFCGAIHPFLCTGCCRHVFEPKTRRVAVVVTLLRLAGNVLLIYHALE